MKFNKLNLKVYLAFSLIVTCIMVACVKTDDLTKDLNIHLNSSVFDTPITLQFVDANSQVPGFPSKVSIEIIGKDKDRILSVLGTKDIKVENNFTILCVKTNDRPTRERPITIHVIARAEGYLDAIVPLTIVDSKLPQAQSVPMINKKTPPKGVAITEKTFAAPAAGLTAAVDIITPLTNGKTEAALAKITQGTKFFDEKGQQLFGDVQATLVHFDNRNEDALRAFPGGLSPTYLVDENNKQMQPGNFETAGFIAFDMTVGGKEVKTFSNPVEVEVDLNMQQNNPETKKPMVAGDKLPVWSLDEKYGVWKKEMEIKIVEEGGKMKAKYQQTHLSWWNLDWWFPYGCMLTGYYGFSWGNPNPWGPPIPPSGGGTTAGIITIQSNVTPACGASPWGGRIYYAELYDPYNPYGFVHSYWDAFNNGTQIQLANYVGGGMIPSIPLRLRIFSGSDWWNHGTVIYTSGDINLCDGPTINVNIPQINPPLSVSVNISGRCGSTLIYPSAFFQFQPANQPYWSFLGYLSNGQGCTSQLYRGQKYNFSVFYGPLQRTYTNITVPQNDTTYLVNNPLTNSLDTLRLQYGPNNSINFNILNMTVPPAMCPF